MNTALRDFQDALISSDVPHRVIKERHGYVLEVFDYRREVRSGAALGAHLLPTGLEHSVFPPDGEQRFWELVVPGHRYYFANRDITLFHMEGQE